MKHQYTLLAITLIALSSFGLDKEPPTTSGSQIESCNVVWDTPSKDSTESMPLSGGLLGLNVWVEDGELRLLMASTNCQNERAQQVKAGLLVVKLGDGQAFASDFRQELRLKQSEIEISGKTKSGASVTVRLWCVANQPIFHVQMRSGEPLAVEARYESWTDYKPEFADGGLRWMRRNEAESAYRLRTIKGNKMEAFADLVPDHLSNLTVGGLMAAPGLKPAGSGSGSFNKMKTTTATLKSARAMKTLDLTVTLRMEQDASVARWNAELARTAKNATRNMAKDRADTLAWWEAFWNRSHVFINPKRAGSGNQGWLAGRNYQLCRYQLAANVSGRWPTLFNGGSFVCNHNPDGRKWGNCYYIAQNMRPMYWPLLKTGDFDMMHQPFDLYRRLTPMAKAYAKQWWEIENGLVFPELLGPFGTDVGGVSPEDGRPKIAHLRYHYTGCMEFAYMMLQYAVFTGADIKPSLPFIEGIVHYYDKYYQQLYRKQTGQSLDENGHLVIYPGDALEMGNGGTNTVTDVTGLTAITRSLLALPDGVLSKEQRNYYAGFLKRIPPLTLADKDGHQILLMGKKMEHVFSSPNMEFPELYVCFPFDYFFLGRQGETGAAGIELARNTWDFGGTNPRVQKQMHCWYQSAINLARMGRTEDAMQYTVRKLVTQHSLRFPTFYSNGGFCCYGPDTDHLGMGMIGLQEMLMQTDGKRILIAPAWPMAWDCDFKLRAPFRTTIEGRIVRGKVQISKVTPEERRQDIEILGPSGPMPPLSQGQIIHASGFWGRLHEPEKAVDGDPATLWTAPRASKSSWLEVDLGVPMEIGRVVIQEGARHQFVTSHAVQAQLADGSWKTLVEGGVIGTDYKAGFDAISAQKFRLKIESRAHATIAEFQLWPN